MEKETATETRSEVQSEQESVDSEPSLWGRFIDSVERSLEKLDSEAEQEPEPVAETKPSLWERYLAIEAELDIPIVDDFADDPFSDDGADFPAPC
jgi:flagellar biosynthesis/type III secretory pathway ATPase